MPSGGLLAGIGGGLGGLVQGYKAGQELQNQKQQVANQTQAQQNETARTNYGLLKDAVDYYTTTQDIGPFNQARARIMATEPPDDPYRPSQQQQNQAPSGMLPPQGGMLPKQGGQAPQGGVTNGGKNPFTGAPMNFPPQGSKPQGELLQSVPAYTKGIKTPGTHAAALAQVNGLNLNDKEAEYYLNEANDSIEKYSRTKLPPLESATLGLKKQELTNAQLKGQVDARQAKGQQIPAGEAIQVSNPDAAAKSIDDLTAAIQQNSDLFGPVKGRFAEGQAKFQLTEDGKRAAVLKNTMAQSSDGITRAMTGLGVRPEMMHQVQEMMASGLKNDPEVVTETLQNLKRTLLEKKNANVSGLQSTNFNMGRLAPSALPNTPDYGKFKSRSGGGFLNSASAGSGAPPPKMGDIKVGSKGNYKFNGGNPNSPSSWELVK